LRGCAISGNKAFSTLSASYQARTWFAKGRLAKTENDLETFRQAMRKAADADPDGVDGKKALALLEGEHHE